MGRVYTIFFTILVSVLTHGQLEESRVVPCQLRFEMPGWCRPEGDVAHERLDLLACLLDMLARQRGEAVHERYISGNPPPAK